MMHASRVPRWLGVLLLLVIAVTFGGNHIAARIAFDHGANVATAVAARSGGTALLLAVLLAATGARLALSAATFARALLIGVALTVQSYCIYSAVARIPVALALLAFNVHPMMLSLLSWLAGGERPTRHTLIAMPVALAGLAVALDVGGWVSGTDIGFSGRWAEIGAGVGFAVGAALSFATVLFLSVRWLHAFDGPTRSFLLMSMTAAIMLAAGSVTHDFAFPSDGTGWLGLVLLTLCYGTAITALFVLLPRLASVHDVMTLNFEPIAVLLIAWPILGQRVAPLQIAGALVVVGAIAALGQGRR